MNPTSQALSTITSNGNVDNSNDYDDDDENDESITKEIRASMDELVI